DGYRRRSAVTVSPFVKEGRLEGVSLPRLRQRTDDCSSAGSLQADVARPDGGHRGVEKLAARLEREQRSRGAGAVRVRAPRIAVAGQHGQMNVVRADFLEIAKGCPGTAIRRDLRFYCVCDTDRVPAADDDVVSLERVGRAEGGDHLVEDAIPRL